VDNELLSLVEEPAIQEDKSSNRHARVSAEDTTTVISPAPVQLGTKSGNDKSIMDFYAPTVNVASNKGTKRR